MKSKIVLGHRSWQLANTHVDAALTVEGGHIGPVVFKIGKKRISPYFVAPWSLGRYKIEPALLQILRGDFFCMPFGGNGTPWHGERHPMHGEPANQIWKAIRLERGSDGSTLFRFALKTKVRPGLVEKQIMLREGHTAVYSRHILRGFRGPMPCAHHPMLAFAPDAGPAFISTSRFGRGQVSPIPSGNPAARTYSQLACGATFRSLSRVPTAEGGTLDVSRYPTPRGYVDLLMLSSPPNARLGWTAVSRPEEGYVWFCLKDPRVLGHTVFWLENGGRHHEPWSDLAGVLGVEDGATYFAAGLAESVRPNPTSRRGFPTCLQLNPRRPTTINHIAGVAAIPRRFDRVRTLRPVRGGIELVSQAGPRVVVPLDIEFLYQQSSA